MHLKLRFRHADSSRIRESQNPNGHSIPCGQLIPKKAACVCSRRPDMGLF
ncbi:hypothetical protein OKW39_003483 [Paraburkholderia sp. MM6662-R1]